MDIVKTVAKMRFRYHAEMIDVCNVCNQLHILSNESAERIMKYHFYECLDSMEHMGTTLKIFLKRSLNKDSFLSPQNLQVPL